MYPISLMRPKVVQQAVLLTSTRRLALKSTLVRSALVHLTRGWVILTGTTFCGSHQGFIPLFNLTISLIYRSATVLLLRLILLDPVHNRSKSNRRGRTVAKAKSTRSRVSRNKLQDDVLSCQQLQGFTGLLFLKTRQ